MDRLLLLFSLAPVMKGFIAMSISGAVFPLCGVMVLRLNLVPMRYMLMHGVILGGAIAMALNVPLLPVRTAFQNELYEECRCCHDQEQHAESDPPVPPRQLFSPAERCAVAPAALKIIIWKVVFCRCIIHHASHHITA